MKYDDEGVVRLGFESEVFLWEYLFLLLWELWGFERCEEGV